MHEGTTQNNARWNRRGRRWIMTKNIEKGRFVLEKQVTQKAQQKGEQYNWQPQQQQQQHSGSPSSNGSKLGSYNHTNPSSTLTMCIRWPQLLSPSINNTSHSREPTCSSSSNHHLDNSNSGVREHGRVER